MNANKLKWNCKVQIVLVLVVSLAIALIGCDDENRGSGGRFSQSAERNRNGLCARLGGSKMLLKVVKIFVRLKA